MTNEKIQGVLHTPNHLRSLAQQLRSEADRAEARAKNIDEGKEDAYGCESGCWNVLSTCIKIQPL